ncbi:UDP-N-acetylmuramoyl-L-alanine--D-glutamate ligase [Idiomarina seosinensis]|uniref:UDP-N-acetylmuramoylalanine--D-glutamate ligase n=1 Tax=Idiomarina seosinensis TaxID=281739 RepID=A0A432ZD66_9GAMM|nr:UDP-N-acetylmuramoyl-L-alanine--D-glutamate ligase [Idiomarina seosinensis]RUO75886.1 UDP-N-acetylmuramoyl-L-alanine--D-glutamate ligase [Idiomarina seosinensis]
MAAIDWQNVEHVTVLGLGKSGLSAVRFLCRQFASRVASGDLIVSAMDSRPQAPGAAQAEELIGANHVHCRDWLLEDTLAADVLVISPGIDPRAESIELAKQAGVIIIGDVELFAQHVTKPVVAITGSNGKSTVTRMVEYIAQQRHINALAAGNIGLPVLDALAEAADAYVLELSSFQLETLESLNPVAATVLNVSPDHLDRYDSVADYAAAKQRIYFGARKLVLNREQSNYWPADCQASVTFGSSSSETGFGLKQHEQETWITFNNKLLIGAHQLAVQGLHNLLNVQAALALAEGLGVSVLEGARRIAGFTGLPHRCQLITERDGVKWVNDSKATNIGATEAAINGMRPVVNGRLLLIAGGVGKDADFGLLGDALKQVDVLLTIGQDGPLIGQPFNGSRQLSSLAEAVKLAASLTEPGDMVLLSPACASFDQFDNFEHRGECFSQAVEALYEQSA